MLFQNLKSFFFLIPRGDGKSYAPHRVGINLQRVFFRSARVEYFSNECFISESDHHMYEHTHTHTVRRKHMEMKSSGRRRGSQRPGNTHTLIQKHTRTLLICMLRRCPLTSTCACLCSAACSRYLSSSRCRPPRKQPKNTQFLAEETCRASKQDRQKAACHTTPAPCACFCVQRNYKTCVFVHH